MSSTEAATKRQTIAPETDAFLDEFFEQVSEAVLLVDREHRALRANPTFVHLFGYSQQEIAGRTVSSLIVPPELRGEAERFAASRARGETVRTETVRMHKDGRRFDVSLLEGPLSVPGGGASGYIICREIPDRKAAETLTGSVRERLESKLRQQSDRLRVLLDLNNRVASHLELRQVFQTLSSELQRIFDCELVGLALPESDGADLRQQMINFPACKGHFKEGTLFPVEGSYAGLAFRTAKAVVLNSLSELRSSCNSEAAKMFLQRVVNEGTQSGCFLPLISQGRVLGVLQLISVREHMFAEHDLEFLDQVANQIAITLRNALEYEQMTETKERLAEQKLYLEDEIRVEREFEEIIGNNPGLKAVLDHVRIVASADSSVLIQGETGTGKELIARAIHELSPRRGQPFVKVNCAAIPSGLLESELFGHEKGAFTGAIIRKIGRFELAHRGTLFLDEIGDIPVELQPKLLRVLQEQEFERLGSTRTQRVDVRLLSATNVDISEMISQKKFRSDLYYRLNVFPISLPPLRERRDDIPLLVRHFVSKYARRMGKQIESISKQTMDALCAYAWPGNVRELQNLIERAVLLSKGPSLQALFPELASTSGDDTVREGNAIQQAERELILKALRESNWIVGGRHGAAARLGLKRTGLAYKMQKLGISRPPK